MSRFCKLLLLFITITGCSASTEDKGRIESKTTRSQLNPSHHLEFQPTQAVSLSRGSYTVVDVGIPQGAPYALKDVENDIFPDPDAASVSVSQRIGEQHKVTLLTNNKHGSYALRASFGGVPMDEVPFEITDTVTSANGEGVLQWIKGNNRSELHATSEVAEQEPYNIWGAN